MSSGFRVNVEPVGTVRGARRLDLIAERAENPRPMFERVSVDLAAVGARRFGNRGDGQWDALKRETIRQKRRLGQPATIGVASGALRKSLSQPRGRGTSRRIYTRAGVMLWRSKRFYAPFGKRDWFRLDRTDRRRITRRMNNYLLFGR